MNAMIPVLAMATLLPCAEPDSDSRERIGEVLGNPVYRDELQTKSLHLLFFDPIVEDYRESHRAIEPTEEETKAAAAYFDAGHREQMEKEGPRIRERLKAIEQQIASAELAEKDRQKLQVERLGLQAKLRPPGRPFANFVLRNWKFQRHLYDRFGGGRVLWQQAGWEAFDAMRKWLEVQ